jgi:hypothetical protein
MMQKGVKIQDRRKARGPALNHANDLLLGEKRHAVLRAHANGRHGASTAPVRGGGGGSNNRATDSEGGLGSLGFKKGVIEN